MSEIPTTTVHGFIEHLASHSVNPDATRARWKDRLIEGNLENAEWSRAIQNIEQFTVTQPNVKSR